MVVPYRKDHRELVAPSADGLPRGADALGMSMGYSLRHVVLKSAFPGIVTGLLLALAIACGGTAPLLYTAGFSDKLPMPSSVPGPSSPI